MRNISNSKTSLFVDNFNEWFVGFTDGEGNFNITYLKERNSFNFQFRITLHIDDIAVLYFIQKTLNVGNVYIENTKSSAVFSISNISHFKEIIFPIFDQFNLNSVKYLNYLAFKEILYLYNSKTHLSNNGLNKMLSIRSSMNSFRTNFTMPIDQKINVTSSWLIGFIEAEGCFMITNRFQPNFTLA